MGQFDVDTEALQRRIDSHLHYGAKDLEKWAFSFIDLNEGLDILDLGCGTGKQTIPLAQMVGEQGRILAMDVSQEALDLLLSQLKALRLIDRVQLIRAELDDIAAHVDGRLFDRAISCYALYYARDPRGVLGSVQRALTSNGIFFFCGPANDNNAELKQFHYALLGGTSPFGTKASQFMSDEGLRLAREWFSSIRVHRFENVLTFVSPESLYEYWSSYNLYDDKLNLEFKRAAIEYFQSHEVFETRKCVIGVQARK
jgi:ubiquinone/menaquinone biosynthesis C-methylase UbiE